MAVKEFLIGAVAGSAQYNQNTPVNKSVSASLPNSFQRLVRVEVRSNAGSGGSGWTIFNPKGTVMAVWEKEGDEPNKIPSVELTDSRITVTARYGGNGLWQVSSHTGPAGLDPATGEPMIITVAQYSYNVYLIYEDNQSPKINLSTTDARTLYENDTINVGGTVQDADAGNVMMVKYQINSGAIRTIHTSISDNSAVPFNRVLTFRNKRLYDGQTAVTGDLQEGAQNTIRVWAEDDQGGRSSDVYRSFQVVPNRPATLTINPVEQQDSLIDSDSITISGSVNDPDGNTVTVEYRLFGESFEQVYNGAGGNFSFNVQLSRLNTGDNNITIRATDSYGATTTRTLKVTKAGAVTPLKRSIATYRINPTNGTAQGVVLWIQRDSGDLNVTLEISATAEGEEEVWEPMTLDSTAFVEDGIEEDEWIYEATDPKEKILLRMTLERENTNSTAGVRLISGVLS